jgi:hypothetical protein
MVALCSLAGIVLGVVEVEAGGDCPRPLAGALHSPMTSDDFPCHCRLNIRSGARLSQLKHGWRADVVRYLPARAVS